MMPDTDLLDVWSYDRYETSVLPYHIYNMCLEEPCIFSLYFLHFLVLAHYYSTSGGETELFIYDKKNNCYIVRNFALDFDHDHILVHTHNFGMILHSLLGMLQIQSDGTDDFSLVAHYFVQLLEDMILIENIL